MRVDWTSKFLSNYYTFYVAGQRMGRMDKNAFSTVSEVEWNGDRYEFKRDSIFQSSQTLYDGDKNPLLHIDFQFLNSKATIRYGERIFTWKFTNIFGSKWVLESNGELIAHGKSNMTSGQIEFLKSQQLPVFLIFSAFQSFYIHSVTVFAFLLFIVVIIL